jgi:DNA-binding XRE family transcriptional regulator
MAKRKNPYISKETLTDFITEQRAKRPGFAREFDKLQLARRVRNLRTRHKLTQVQLAHRAGTHQEVIARLESGRIVPKLDLLQRLAAAMGLDINVQFIRSRPSHG